jgi:hypothetical protein
MLKPQMVQRTLLPNGSLQKPPDETHADRRCNGKQQPLAIIVI